MGLRYVQVEWKDDNLVFTVLAETEESLRESYAAIQRDDATAFAPAVSSDPWTFRIDDRVVVVGHAVAFRSDDRLRSSKSFRKHCIRLDVHGFLLLQPMCQFPCQTTI